jgi:hypothetical protein
MTRKTLYFRRFSVVAFLHPVLTGTRARAGIGLPEVVVAVTVLGAGIIGVAAVGGAARKLATIAAVRSAQTVVAGTTLERAPADVRENLGVMVDTVGVAPGLIEIRLTVSGSGLANERLWVARRPSRGP